MKGYWRRREAAAEMIDDDWPRTGDVGVRDPAAASAP